MSAPEDPAVTMLETVAAYLSARQTRLELAFRELEAARRGTVTITGRRLGLVWELVREALAEDCELAEYVRCERRRRLEANGRRGGS